MASKTKNKDSDVLYSAKMLLSPVTVTRLTNIQYNEYNMLAKLVQILSGIALAPISIYVVEGKAAKYILLGVALFLIATANATPRANAKHFPKMYGGYPSFLYIFKDDCVGTNNSDETMPYEKITRLVEDDKYLYFFENQLSVSMLDKSTVFGDGGVEGLKRLLEEKTGHMWKAPSTPLTFFKKYK